MGKILWIVIVFLVVGAYIITTSSGLDLSDANDQKNFIEKFLSWLKMLGGNVKVITGQVIGMDWLPQAEDLNETNATEVN